MAVVQAFNRERAFQAEFDGLNDANREAATYAQKLSSVFFPGIQLLGIVATACALVVGAQLHADGTLTLGTLIAFIGMLSLVFQPLQELSELYGQVQSASAAMGKISGVLDTEPDLDRQAGREAAAAGRGPARHRPRRLRLRLRARCCTTSTCTCGPAAAWPWSARPAAASRPSRS